MKGKWTITFNGYLTVEELVNKCASLCKVSTDSVEAVYHLNYLTTQPGVVETNIRGIHVKFEKEETE